MAKEWTTSSRSARPATLKIKAPLVYSRAHQRGPDQASVRTCRLSGARERALLVERAVMARTRDDPAAVDDYLAGLSPDRREALEQPRQLVKSTVPGVRERISYGTAVIFALNSDLVGFVAQPKHLSFFTMSPALARTMKAEIEQTHRVSGATIHFSPDNPLPTSLVKRILAARVREQGESAST